MPWNSGPEVTVYVVTGYLRQHVPYPPDEVRGVAQVFRQRPRARVALARLQLHFNAALAPIKMGRPLVAAPGGTRGSSPPLTLGGPRQDSQSNRELTERCDFSASR
jgi:hypothetical protein